MSAPSIPSVFVRTISLCAKALIRAGFTRLTTCPASLSAIATASLQPSVASKHAWTRSVLRFFNQVCSCAIPAGEFGTVLEAERSPCSRTT
jgi:hypothetical protein